ncbi:MAG: Zn-dependent hydrolase of the beta-lactamase fold-like protein [Candidatus Magasanikbacteria bacterium GW2011_GWA2_56_11]|uniref:Zn-dependent hydrolase of the beta-lactamase fold-like protein n=1 Tax=Candidatus Magasanikbacteria bacterium GW2011_GWA2_56_11 TaxID=1619044 RepID=A0A0G1YHQ1_9BACT|nr:MAG: Zn-dependent hydrolase of the beta-lactamase fold-like protein [Candidatus Magasanikbacteria bacterium GW2011_GWA2_56_11]
MHISWLGSTSIKLQTKSFDEDVVIAIDPYRPAAGNFPRSMSPQIALFTRGQEGAVTLTGSPFVLDTPGECDSKGILVTAVPGEVPGRTMLRIDAEQLSLAHLGSTAKPLTEAQREVLSDVDILFVPVGGKDCYDAEAAVKTVNDLEPRVVIPVAYQSESDPEAATVDAFLKEMGASGAAREAKVIIKKKDLPTEETQVIVLTKE